jgi:FeS assembly SUF system protein
MTDFQSPYGAFPPPENPEFTATEGTPLEPGTAAAAEDQVIAAMRTVFDPEIPVNIYDLGLIYETTIHASGTMEIEMSLTAPGCPVAGEMPGEVARAVAALPGAGEVTVRLVWDPPWTPERMSEDAKLALGMF